MHQGFFKVGFDLYDEPYCSGYLPWILKRGGLVTSGQRLIALNGKTKRIKFMYVLMLCKQIKVKKLRMFWIDRDFLILLNFFF